MRIAEADEALARSSLEAGVAFGLLQRFDEPDLPSLYHPPGLLRPWLSDPERLSERKRPSSTGSSPPSGGRA